MSARLFLQPPCLFLLVLLAVGCRKAAEPRTTLAMVTVGPGAVAIAHRAGSEAPTTEVDLVDPASGTARWRATVAAMEASEDALLATADTLVAVARGEGRTPPSLIGLDLANGTPRWQRVLERWPAEVVIFSGMWAHEGVLVVRASSGDTARLIGLEARTGAELWHTDAVSSHEAPIFVGAWLLVPTRHATQPPLRLVALRSGETRGVGAGLAWPGLVNEDRYLALFSPGARAEALVSAETLRGGGPDPQPATATTPWTGPRSGVHLVALDLATGALAPQGLTVPDGCADPTAFFQRGDRVFCTFRDGTSMWSSVAGDATTTRVIAPDEGWRIWDGGSVERRWRRPETLAFSSTPGRYAPLVLNERGTDDARVCVLDLDEVRLAWCSEREITDEQIHIYGWLHIHRRAELHLIHLPVHHAPSHHHGPVAILDGNTGRFVGALELRTGGLLPGWPGVSTGHPRAGDVLVSSVGPFVWGVDLRRRTLTFQRGPQPIELVDAVADAERILGPLPR